MCLCALVYYLIITLYSQAERGILEGDHISNNIIGQGTHRGLERNGNTQLEVRELSVVRETGGGKGLS